LVLSAELGSGLFVWLIGERRPGLIGGLGIELGFGLIFALIGEVAVGTQPRPNGGIWNSTRNLLLGGLLGGLILGLSSGLLVGVNPSVRERLLIGLSGGLLGALMLCGGFASIQHMTLRALLWRYNLAPLNYAKFLEDCAERIFLRRVGGGYIFIHRMLMEHFAAMTEAEIDELVRGD
jgi:hypothetical protein